MCVVTEGVYLGRGARSHGPARRTDAPVLQSSRHDAANRRMSQPTLRRRGGEAAWLPERTTTRNWSLSPSGVYAAGRQVRCRIRRTHATVNLPTDAEVPATRTEYAGAAAGRTRAATNDARHHVLAPPQGGGMSASPSADDGPPLRPARRCCERREGPTILCEARDSHAGDGCAGRHRERAGVDFHAERTRARRPATSRNVVLLSSRARRVTSTTAWLPDLDRDWTLHTWVRGPRFPGACRRACRRRYHLRVT
jgi:hypothetical protein